MTYQRTLGLVLVSGSLLVATGCASRTRPPNLSPEAQLASTNGQVVSALDDVRDVALAFFVYKQRPFDDVTITRRVVQAHESSLKLIDIRTTGWENVVKKTLEELMKNLPPDAARRLSPYATLATVLIDTLGNRAIDEVASADAIAAYQAVLKASLALDADWLASH
jgi:hypothetical protein